jgi:Stage II sporulation protein M
MDASRLRTGVLAVAVATGVTGSVLLVALVTRVALASPARGWLHYTFPGVPARLNSALWIFTNNGRELMGALGVLLIAQIAARRSDGPTRAQQLVRTGGEVVLAGAIAANVLVVGAAVGVYGERMVRAMVPHGPFEVAAYSLALTLYLQGRRRPLPAARLAGTIAVSVALLALAALLETYR